VVVAGEGPAGGNTLNLVRISPYSNEIYLLLESVFSHPTTSIALPHAACIPPPHAHLPVTPKMYPTPQHFSSLLLFKIFCNPPIFQP